jgi:DNA-binding MarR family transcriptional regulator
LSHPSNKEALMIETAKQQAPEGKTAAELLRFLNEMMRAMARVDLGDPGVAQLTFLEMRILVTLGECGRAIEIHELAQLSHTSLGQSGQACDALRGRGLADRAGGGRGPERALVITAGGRRLLASLEATRRAAVESLISGLGRSERLRLDGAAHLLGHDLERLSRGMLAA